MPLFAEFSESWYTLLRQQFNLSGFGASTPVSYRECWIPGENSRPNTPKPPLLMPVVKPSEAFLEEHGVYGRYDFRSKMARGLFPSIEQEEGLESDNGVFRFEFFNFHFHFAVNGSAVAEEIKTHGFGITNEFTAAHAGQPILSKLQEIAEAIKNAGERTGLDVAHIHSQQWAAIFRHANAMLLGSVNLPDFRLHVAAGVTEYHYPLTRTKPLPILHSIVSQINTAPVMERIYHEPPAVFIEMARQ